MPSSNDGGSMLGNEKKVTWHTFEAPTSLSAYRGAARLIQAGNEVHLCYNPMPSSGEVPLVQMLPANRAGRGLRNTPGGVQTNRSGAINIQIEVIAYASIPWTKHISPAGSKALDRIMDWLRSLGIPDALPAGNPPPYPNGSNPRSTSAWDKSGHFNHSQVPENFHGDSGAISMGLIFDHGTKAPAPKPAPKPVPTPIVKDSTMVLAYDFSGTDFYLCGVAGKRKIQKITYDALLAAGVPTLGKRAANMLADFPTL